MCHCDKMQHVIFRVFFHISHFQGLVILSCTILLSLDFMKSDTRVKFVTLSILCIQRRRGGKNANKN